VCICAASNTPHRGDGPTAAGESRDGRRGTPTLEQEPMNKKGNEPPATIDNTHNNTQRHSPASAGGKTPSFQNLQIHHDPLAAQARRGPLAPPSSSSPPPPRKLRRRRRLPWPLRSTGARGLGTGALRAPLCEVCMCVRACVCAGRVRVLICTWRLNTARGT